ncbi:MAG TPA: dihydrofolate reductase [Steroidobacteraceae bacterium]|nr:dihydrofolate reductase [Steroidobacteraceae bacterium]
MTPKLSIVVAASDNNVIGVRNELPWHLPDDLRRFKALTMGKPVVMGRKTFESIGKPLPGRTNVVVTRQRDWSAPGCVIANSIADAIEHADAAEIMIIGGAQIFAEVLPQVNTIHLTRVDVRLDGDAFFPELAPSDWRETNREDHAADARHAYAFSFVTLERISARQRV